MLMLLAQATTAAAARDLLNGRLATDGGPIYAETNLSGCPVEPWSAASGIAFVVVALFWLWRLRGQYRQYAVLSVAMPLMLVGGVGCMLYHGLRSSRAFLLMDAMPLPVLCLLAAAWAWRRYAPKLWHAVMLACVVGVLGVRAAGGVLPLQVQITVAYGMLFILILLPVVLLLVRSRGAGLAMVIGAVVLAGCALTTRSLDALRPPLLPMGTHWLTHVFGAAGTFCLVAWIHAEISRDPRPTAAEASAATASGIPETPPTSLPADPARPSV